MRSRPAGAIRAARKQRGVVLFISLIVLVAMTLAGIAIMRSVDTGNVVSGNMAFKEGTLASADNGIAAAFTWLTGTINNPTTYTTLEQDIPAQGYHAVVSDPASPPENPKGTPDWSNDAIWQDALVLGTDTAGNTTKYIIHRMCDGPGPYSGANCSQVPKIGAAGGNSQGVGASQYNSPPMVYYRVTVRVDGPRETMTIVQSNIALQQ